MHFVYKVKKTSGITHANCKKSSWISTEQKLNKWCRACSYLQPIWQKCNISIDSNGKQALKAKLGDIESINRHLWIFLKNSGFFSQAPGAHMFFRIFIFFSYGNFLAITTYKMPTAPCLNGLSGRILPLTNIPISLTSTERTNQNP